MKIAPTMVFVRLKQILPLNAFAIMVLVERNVKKLRAQSNHVNITVNVAWSAVNFHAIVEMATWDKHVRSHHVKIMLVFMKGMCFLQ